MPESSIDIENQIHDLQELHSVAVRLSLAETNSATYKVYWETIKATETRLASLRCQLQLILTNENSENS